MHFPMLPDGDMAAAKARNARILPASFVVGAEGRIPCSIAGELDWSAEPQRSPVAGLPPR